MRAKASYLWIGLIVAVLMSLSFATVEKLRSAVVTVASPLWRRVNAWTATDSHQPMTSEEQLQALALENRQLKNELERVLELLSLEQSHSSHLTSIPARVIARSPTSWNSTLWLDVGEADNDAAGKTIIAKNSPVVVGDSLVGVVDLVNRHQCRVRLITDAHVSPSVRAVRGNIQRQQLLEHLDALASALANEETLLNPGKERTRLLEGLLDVREKLIQATESWELAKGELHGSAVPLWRSSGAILQGVGFNYDFADEAGPARDLASGRIMGSNLPGIPLLKVDDILVTTGMDGVFPAGLRVGQVTTVYPLGEGDYFYELEARPTAGSLDSLSLVSVLPPQFGVRQQP